jgi:hypothetical protein
MKLSKAIAGLQKLQETLREKGIKKDPEVIVDYEEDVGWFDVENLHIAQEGGDYFVNIKSSNET